MVYRINMYNMMKQDTNYGANRPSAPNLLNKLELYVLPEQS